MKKGVVGPECFEFFGVAGWNQVPKATKLITTGRGPIIWDDWNLAQARADHLNEQYPDANFRVFGLTIEAHELSTSNAKARSRKTRAGGKT